RTAGSNRTDPDGDRRGAPPAPRRRRGCDPGHHTGQRQSASRPEGSLVTGHVTEVADAIRTRQSFILTSHARPDGDAIGSSLALAFALERLGKRAAVVLRDPVPEPYRSLPGIERLTFAAQVTA